jgi:hypothetical protein
MANRFTAAHAPRARSVQNASRRMRLVLPIDRSVRIRFAKLQLKQPARLGADTSAA